MTTDTRSLDTTEALPSVSLHAAHLPRWVPYAVLAVSAASAAAVGAVLGLGTAIVVGLGWLLFVATLPLLSWATESARSARNRLFTTLVTSAFVLAVLPLLSLLWTVVERGVPALSAEFFTYSMRNIVGEGGGIYHALLGTLVITALATLISVPIGLLVSIYLVEYGTGRLARQITFLVDVMTGVPSIVAGLFAYALFVLFLGPGVRMGLIGAVALSVLMIPVVVRSGEEMLRLVPDELREASYALGVPKWRTVLKVVLPTAAAGIVTGVTLAIARVIGETAPLLVVAGFTDSVNLNPFSGRMMTLPVFSFAQNDNPGFPPEAGIERAWGAALVLMLIVMLLNLLARAVSYLFSPKGSR